MRIIGIHGFKGSGKDTIYSQMGSILDEPTKRHAFADNLKVMAMRALGYEGEREALLEDADWLKAAGFVDSVIQAGEGTHLSGRQYIINFGQEARATFGQDFWVDQVLPLGYTERIGIWNVSEKGQPYRLPAVACVTDVRMANEAERVRAVGGEIWHVVRPGAHSDGQVTEQELPAWLIDETIVNDGDLSTLRHRVAELLAKGGTR